MSLQAPTSTRVVTTSAPALVMCQQGWLTGMAQAASSPHPMYAYAFELARRAVAERQFRRQNFRSMN